MQQGCKCTYQSVDLGYLGPDGVAAEVRRILLDFALETQLEALLKRVDRVGSVFNLARQLEDGLGHVCHLGRILLVRVLRLQLKAEQVLNHVFSIFVCALQGLPPRLENGVKCFIGVLLLMMPASLVDLVEDRVRRAQRLNELHWWVREVLSLQVFHHLPAGKCHQHVRVHSAGVLWRSHFFQSSLELIDALEALNDRVHVTGVSQVFEAGRDHDGGFLVHDRGALLRSHVFDELSRLGWLSQALLLRRAHHHESHSILKPELG